MGICASMGVNSLHRSWKNAFFLSSLVAKSYSSEMESVRLRYWTMGDFPTHPCSLKAKDLNAAGCYIPFYVVFFFLFPHPSSEGKHGQTVFRVVSEGTDDSRQRAENAAVVEVIGPSEQGDCRLKALGMFLIMWTLYSWARERNWENFTIHTVVCSLDSYFSVAFNSYVQKEIGQGYVFLLTKKLLKEEDLSGRDTDVTLLSMCRAQKCAKALAFSCHVFLGMSFHVFWFVSPSGTKTLR